MAAPSAGLSRRRVGATDGTTSSPTMASMDTSKDSPGTSSGGFEGRSKIAFDPRDFNDGGESKGTPKLTLLEEVLLLGLKDNQGYTSWFNDNISYALRGCILLELALRRRIAVVKDPSRRRLALGDRLIEVIDDRQTGETILDEALKMIKGSEKYGTAAWVDLMSGETWNVMKIGYQLKQVRERLAKGLVDKGVLRTEKRNFLLFDMATHPVSDARTKADILRRTVSFLTTKTTAIPTEARLPEGIRYRTMRAVCLCCAAYAANVLENALQGLEYEPREAAFTRCDNILAEFCTWPFGIAGYSSGSTSSSSTTPARKRQQSNSQIASGGSGVGTKEIMVALVEQVRKEMLTDGGAAAKAGPGGGEGGAEEDLSFEVVATVLEVFSRMDSLL